MKLFKRIFFNNFVVKEGLLRLNSNKLEALLQKYHQTAIFLRKKRQIVTAGITQEQLLEVDVFSTLNYAK